MHQQITTTTNNFPTSRDLFIFNAQQVKIRDLKKDETLKQGLRYCLALTGITAKNLPSDMQKVVLINFIKTQLGKYTVEEIKTAFDLAVAKKTGVKIQNYQNFSSIYVSEVMFAYDRYIRSNGFKREELNPMPLPKREEINIMEHYNHLFKKSLETGRNEFKGGDLSTLGYDKVIPTLYDKFYRQYDTSITDDQARTLFENMRQTVIQKNFKSVKNQHYIDLKEKGYLIDGKFVQGYSLSNPFYIQARNMCQIERFEFLLQDSINKQKTITIKDD